MRFLCVLESESAGSIPLQACDALSYIFASAHRGYDREEQAKLKHEQAPRALAQLSQLSHSKSPALHVVLGLQVERECRRHQEPTRGLSLLETMARKGLHKDRSDLSGQYGRIKDGHIYHISSVSDSLTSHYSYNSSGGLCPRPISPRA